MYSETYHDLCHGTDEKSAENIKLTGFQMKGGQDSWCGKGVYFYDIKKKAWWAANRKCGEIKRNTGEKVKPTVIFADIIDIADEDIFDLRVYTDLCEFEKTVSPMLEDVELTISGMENATEKNIVLRSLLISFFAETNNKKLVVGNFRQRPQEQYEHAIEFANNLDMIFGIETIYCVKDISIISNVHQGGIL